MKHKIFNNINKLNDDESGVTSIEYAVIISLLSFVLLIAFPPISKGVAGNLDTVDIALGGQSTPQSSVSPQNIKGSGNCSKSGGSGGSGSSGKYGGWGW